MWPHTHIVFFSFLLSVMWTLPSLRKKSVHYLANRITSLSLASLTFNFYNYTCSSNAFDLLLIFLFAVGVRMAENKAETHPRLKWLCPYALHFPKCHTNSGMSFSTKVGADMFHAFLNDFNKILIKYWFLYLICTIISSTVLVLGY